ncbi:hypothetical protein DFH07DRAFT_1061552 [Mycena maculata]|uniref:Cyclin N-terminal domain-containing protein n=1 Tax=Mycena maculata TaxID=230809 RepID=A0AAD7IZQ5_9AGAR|nr:hypothetical protein DFH07DRAFT_1061552 [Mycena maculata]
MFSPVSHFSSPASSDSSSHSPYSNSDSGSSGSAIPRVSSPEILEVKRAHPLIEYVPGCIPETVTIVSPHIPSAKRGNCGRPVHPASLVDPMTHSPALMQLLEIKLSRPVIDYVVDCVYETVDHALGRLAFSLPTRGRSPARSNPRKKFTSFVSNVLARAEVSPATLLVALIYIARARRRLVLTLRQYALERVFLGALIVSNKYTSDKALKNRDWARCTGFGKYAIGCIEQEFLDALDWELGVREADLLAHHEGLVVADLGSSVSRLYVKAAVEEAHDARVHTHCRRSSLTTPVVPELDPSSPRSSVESIPPRTPILQASPQDKVPSVKHARIKDPPIDARVDAHANAPAPMKKHMTFYNLLRSFPIPPRHHRRFQPTA